MEAALAQAQLAAQAGEVPVGAVVVRDGEVFWITVLFSAGGAGDADLSHTQQWHEQFPNNAIPVLADTNLDLYNWIGVTSYPVLNLLADEFSLDIYDDGGPYSVLRELPDIL